MGKDQLIVDKEARTVLAQSMKEEFCYQFSENMVVMTTCMVANVILLHRKGISQQELLKECQWIHKEVEARGVKIGLQALPSSSTIRAALDYLKGFVD